MILEVLGNLADGLLRVAAMLYLLEYLSACMQKQQQNTDLHFSLSEISKRRIGAPRAQQHRFSSWTQRKVTRYTAHARQQIFFQK